MNTIPSRVSQRTARSPISSLDGPHSLKPRSRVIAMQAPLVSYSQRWKKQVSVLALPLGPRATRAERCEQTLTKQRIFLSMPRMTTSGVPANVIVR